MSPIGLLSFVDICVIVSGTSGIHKRNAPEGQKCPSASGHQTVVIRSSNQRCLVDGRLRASRIFEFKYANASVFFADRTANIRLTIFYRGSFGTDFLRSRSAVCPFPRLKRALALKQKNESLKS